KVDAARDAERGTQPAVDVATGLADPSADAGVERVVAERADAELGLVAALHRGAGDVAGREVAQRGAGGEVAAEAERQAEVERVDPGQRTVGVEVVPRDAEAGAGAERRGQAEGQTKWLARIGPQPPPPPPQ